MTTRPRLVRSVPFWGLIVGSAASAVAGILLLVDKLDVMATTLTDGTATGIEVYVGQIWAVFGAILVGVGVIGILLALTVAALGSLRPAAPVEVVEPIDWTSDEETVAEGDRGGYDRGLGYTGMIDTVAQPAEQPAR